MKKIIFFLILGGFMSADHLAARAAGPDTQGEITSGFRLIEIRKIKEIDGVARIFEHVKSGARLLYLSNDDDNKVFSIGFRTIPQDDSGVAHILEHSVLTGSNKFPTKEPFVELAKGSVKTFLNAMTYPDKTVYPVASRNDKDFRNLMDVYMDAVLHPNIHQNPYALMQEGWRYELDEKTGELQYNGIVYNEMKGGLSNPDWLLEDQIRKTLFPKSHYRFESGGIPSEIPSLTPEAFTGFHRRFYHPSNSYIYLYGNGNIQEHLKFLDEQYLSAYSKEKTDSATVLQPAFKKPAEKTAFYSINKTESPKGKTHLSLNYVIDQAPDAELFFGFDILKRILLDMDSSPLKRALIEAGISKSIDSSWDPGNRQPLFEIIAKNTEGSKQKLFESTIEKTLKNLATKGISPKLIEAAINRKEFLLREFDTGFRPKGLSYFGLVMNSWLYEGDPLLYLQFEPILEKIKKQASSGYFEKLIREKLLQNKHRALVVLKPKPGLDEQKAKALQAQLKKIKSKLKPRELEEITNKTAELKRRQKEPDSPQALETIPLLKISDLNKEAEILPIRELSTKEAGYKLFHHAVFTNKIVYLGLYFDISGVKESDLPALTLLSEILGKVDTTKRGFQELSSELNTQIGGFSQGLSSFTRKESLNLTAPRYVVRGKALLGKNGKMLELFEEILLHSRLDDVKRLKEIVLEIKSRMKDGILGSGESFAMMRAESYLSKTGVFEELTGGISFYRFITQVEKDLDKDPKKVIFSLQSLAADVFSRPNLLISTTNTEQEFESIRPELEKFAMVFQEKPAQKNTAQAVEHPLKKENEGIMIPSNVQFVAQVADFRKSGFEYSGKLLVTKRLVSSDYLWSRLRVLGGAYGGWMDANWNGGLSFLSYRDPGLKETLKVYSEVVGYLRKLDLSPRELSKYIIGSISGLDMPLTPVMKGSRAMSNYLTQITQADIQKIRDEVLSAKLEEIRAQADLIEKSLAQNCYAVVGGEKKIQENKSLFGKTFQALE